MFILFGDQKKFGVEPQHMFELELLEIQNNFRMNLWWLTKAQQEQNFFYYGHM